MFVLGRYIGCPAKPRKVLEWYESTAFTIKEQSAQFATAAPKSFKTGLIRKFQ